MIKWFGLVLIDCSIGQECTHDISVRDLLALPVSSRATESNARLAGNLPFILLS